MTPTDEARVEKIAKVVAEWLEEPDESVVACIVRDIIAADPLTQEASVWKDAAVNTVVERQELYGKLRDLTAEHAKLKAEVVEANKLLDTVAKAWKAAASKLVFRDGLDHFGQAEQAAGYLNEFVKTRLRGEENG